MVPPPFLFFCAMQTCGSGVPYLLSVESKMPPQWRNIGRHSI